MENCEGSLPSHSASPTLSMCSCTSSCSTSRTLSTCNAEERVQYRNSSRAAAVWVPCSMSSNTRCTGQWQLKILAVRCTAQHSTAQHSTAQHSTAQHSTAQHSTAQHSTAQHSTAQHSTAQHSTAQRTRSSISLGTGRPVTPSKSGRLELSSNSGTPSC